MPLASRIIKAVNAYDDLVGDSRGRLRRLDALERLRLGMAYEYDPTVVESLAKTRRAHRLGRLSASSGAAAHRRSQQQADTGRDQHVAGADDLRAARERHRYDVAEHGQAGVRSVGSRIASRARCRSAREIPARWAAADRDRHRRVERRRRPR